MPGLPLALAFALAWIPLFVFRAEAPGEALPFYSPAERFWVRLSPMVVALHMTLACIAVSLEPAVPLWRAALGSTVFAAGIAFWFWGRMQIGPLRIRRLPDEPPRHFRHDGAFGLVRNPLYFGVLVAGLAPVIVAPRPVLGATYFACAAALAVRAAQEERRLHEQLGPAYAAYCRQVKRLIPFVW